MLRLYSLPRPASRVVWPNVSVRRPILIAIIASLVMVGLVVVYCVLH
jgi:hypothetical protein